LHTRVPISYFVCGTPRSGTNLLTGLLRSTGVAGKPEEFFWREVIADWGRDWRTDTFREYLAAAARDGATPNGVFAAKVMWGQMGAFLGLLRTLPGEPADSDRALIERSFPGARFVWMRRRDTVAQAVSWTKAEQTGVWYDHADGAPARDPQFDAETIEHHLGEIAEHNDGWAGWFAANGVEPAPVFYEDLVADGPGVTRAVLGFLGLEVPDGVAIAAQTTRQADALNDEWIERYRELAAARGS
jgi:LPS sulfotransferase NodH